MGANYPAINTFLIIVGLLPILGSFSVYIWKAAQARGAARERDIDVERRLRRLEGHAGFWRHDPDEDSPRDDH